LIVALFIVGATSTRKTNWDQLDEKYTFDRYLKEFGKSYADAHQYYFRKNIFDAKLKTILQHNKQATSWKKGLNQFTDRTHQEYSRLLGYSKSYAYKTHLDRQNRVDRALWSNLKQEIELPNWVDWRTAGIITAVKDQGDCGSCWTFGTAEVVESHWALATHQLADLSEQQILDCTPNPNSCGGTGGCNGGTPELAYQQLILTGGMASEWTYPYRSYQGAAFNCSYDLNTPKVAVLKNYTVLPSNEYTPVMNALAYIGPLAINVDASDWSDYETGVFTGCNATHPDIDHVVQLVGYGSDPQFGDFWLIRNSWSPVWGEQGYIRLIRSARVECGVDLSPSDGTGCSGGPPNVTVCGACGILYDVSFPVVDVE
jgi:cathepsin L